MVAYLFASTTTARSNSTPTSIVISTTATPLPVTAPRALPPNASSFTPIPVSTRTCSTPASPTSPSLVPATKPRSSPTTWQNSVPNSEPTSRKPPPWISVKLHPSHRESGWGSERRIATRDGDDENDDHSRELQQHPVR